MRCSLWDTPRFTPALTILGPVGPKSTRPLRQRRDARLAESGRIGAVQRPPPATTATDAADRLIAEGNQAENDGRVWDACRLYREAVAAAPGYARAHLNLGIGLEASDQPDAALEAYRSAVALDPKSAPSSYNLARLLWTLGDPTQA